MITQIYKQYKQQGIAFRIYGKGAPLVLLHPSPNNSAMLHPLASALADSYTVICPDTPGYGLSDDMYLEQPSASDYVDRFNTLFDSLGLSKFAIYGTATGAQLGIRFSIEFPDKIEHLYLDNSAHFTEDERSKILKHYFPDLTPKEDGSHIKQIWEIASNLFNYFPWCFQSAEYALNLPPIPVEVINSVAIDFLIAGKDYDKAYRAAFMHEKVEYVQQLEVETTILRWQGSILKPYTDRLFDYQLPPNINQKVISAPQAQRFAEIKDYIQKTYSTTAQQLDTLTEHAVDIQEGILAISHDVEKPNLALDGAHLTDCWKKICMDTRTKDLSLEEKQDILIHVFKP